jgi:DNA-binding GntR family transcriptional regulator
MPVPRERDAAERRLLKDTAYTKLCDAIVTGTLTPGEQLHDQELCAWLGLSRTPVRGALARLEDEGLVVTAAQRFTRVAPIDRREIRESFPVLATLHGLATELAVPELEPHDLATLQAANHDFTRALRDEDGPAAFEADARFHHVFLAAADNREVNRALDRLDPRLHRLERLCTDVLPGRRSVAQHQAIRSRAAAGEAAGAASAVRANWLTLGSVIERCLLPEESVRESAR